MNGLPPQVPEPIGARRAGWIFVAACGSVLPVAALGMSAGPFGVIAGLLAMTFVVWLCYGVLVRAGASVVRLRWWQNVGFFAGLLGIVPAGGIALWTLLPALSNP